MFVGQLVVVSDEREARIERFDESVGFSTDVLEIIYIEPEEYNGFYDVYVRRYGSHCGEALDACKTWLCSDGLSPADNVGINKSEESSGNENIDGFFSEF